MPTFLELFGNNRRYYVSIYGGVLSLFVKFFRTKIIKFVKNPIFIGKKITGKYGRCYKDYLGLGNRSVFYPYIDQ